MKMTKNLTMMLVGIWILASGLLFLIPALNFSGSGNILAILAVVAGLLLIFER